MVSLNYQVARGAMSMIANQARIGHLDNIGISIEDFEKVNGQVPWMAVDRNRVTLALNTMLTSTLDVIGLPRFQLPAEYMAAGIALFVAPINVHSACRFIERPGSSESLGRGVDEPERCTAQQLFALIVQLVSDPERSAAKHMFERNTGIKLALASEGVNEGSVGVSKFSKK